MPAIGRHTVEDGSKASAGQSSLMPSQCSATSQGPAAARHSAVLLASAGQAALAPVQFSAGSQAPAEGRQTVDEEPNASAGQAALAPVQFSATSHAPAAAG